MMTQERFNISNLLRLSLQRIEHSSYTRGRSALDVNALQIWPRKHFMMIALPKIDKSFTVSMFFPVEGENSFENLTTEDEAKYFFEKIFKEIIPFAPRYLEDFF